jgi:hypothetical protein
LSDPGRDVTAPARPTRRDDRLALAAIVLGTVTALVGLHVPLTLSTGVALGFAGVLLAVRGDRAVPAPGLLASTLALAVAATAGAALVALYEDWEIGQHLAEGAAPAYVSALVRPWVRLGAALRSLGLFAGLALLVGAAVTRVGGSGK